MTDPGLGDVWVSTLEDALIAKLEWSGGDLDGIQGRDARTIAAGGGLDIEYLRQQAADLGLSGPLEAVLGRA